MQLIDRKFWWVLVASLIKASTCLRGPWLTVPQIVKAGDSITLSCEYDLENVALYSVKWYRNGHEFFRYTPGDNPRLKYFWIKNIDLSRSGATQVTMKNIVREQSGRYECEVSTDAPFFQTEIQNSTMIVVEIPSGDPSIKINCNSATIGTKLSADCYMGPSDPPANITWSINGEEVSGINGSVEISPHNYDNDGVSRKIEITTDSSHFLQGVLSLECEAHIYNIWNRTAEMPVKEEVPLKLMAELAVGSSTSSPQSQMDDPDSDFLYNSSYGSFNLLSFNVPMAIQLICYAFCTR